MPQMIQAVSGGMAFRQFVSQLSSRLVEELTLRLTTGHSFKDRRWLQRQSERFNFVGRNAQVTLLEHSTSHPMLESRETAIGCVGRPRLAVRVAEERALGMLGDKPLRDLQGLVGQVDRPRLLLAFGFFRREYPAAVLQIHMPSLNVQRLLRTAAGFPTHHQQITKRLVTHEAEDTLEFLGRDNDFSLTRTRLFVIRNRTAVDVPFLRGPAHGTLHSPYHVVLRPARPLLVLVRTEPVVEMVGTQLSDTQPAIDAIDEELQAPAIPLVRCWLAMFLAPLQVLVDQTDHRVAGSRQLRRDRLGSPQQLLVAFERFRLVGAKIVLFAVKRDVPEPTLWSKPRLG